MFSKKDRETVSSIREMFSKDGNMPEYREDLNAVILAMNGKFDTHLLFVGCLKNVLKIMSARSVDARNCSGEFFRYVMELNLSILLGYFCYSSMGDQVVYKLNVPLNEKPEKEFITKIITYAFNVLDDCVPEIISHIHENQNGNEEKRNSTYH